MYWELNNKGIAEPYKYAEFKRKHPNIRPITQEIITEYTVVSERTLWDKATEWIYLF